MKRWVLFLLMTAAPVFGVDTTIKGGRMELINKGETVVFTGGVKLNRGGDELKAERMKTNRERDRISANGNVYLFRQVSATETWKGFGDDGFYDTQSGEGYLLGDKKAQAHVIHTEVLSSTMTRIVHIYAHRIDFMKDKKHALAVGAVKGSTVDPQTDERYEFWADKANFDGQSNTLTLTGVVQPILIQTIEGGKRTLKGDTVVYNTAERHLWSEGNAEAVFEDDKAVKDAKK